MPVDGLSRHVLSKNFSRASARETPSPQRDSGKPGQRRLPLVLYTNIVMGHLTDFCLMCHAFPRGFSWYFSMFPVMKFLFFYGKLLVLSRNLILLHWASCTWPIAFFYPVHSISYIHPSETNWKSCCYFVSAQTISILKPYSFMKIGCCILSLLYPFTH